MAGAGAPNRLRRAILAAALVAGYGGSVLYSMLLSRMGGDTSSVWTATGFLAGMLILLSGRSRIVSVGLCLVFQAAVSLAVGDGLGRALFNPPVNLFEAGVAAWLGVTYCGAGARRLSLRKLALILVGAITPAAMLGALVGAVVNSILRGQPFLDGWLAWAIPSGLGMAIVTPGLLLVARENQYKEFRRSGIETMGLLSGVCGLTGAAFFQSELPLQFVIFPALTLVAFRLGPPGGAIAGFFIAVICLSLVVLGHGPSMLSTTLDQVGRVRLTQAVVASALCTTLATAALVADQARLRNLLIGRDRAVRAARVRARAAERAALEAIDQRTPATSRSGAHFA